MLNLASLTVYGAASLAESQKVWCFQVLYLTEPIDEVAIQNVAEYDDKKFVDVSREGIDLGTDDQDTKKVGAARTCPSSLSLCLLVP